MLQVKPHIDIGALNFGTEADRRRSLELIRNESSIPPNKYVSNSDWLLALPFLPMKVNRTLMPLCDPGIHEPARKRQKLEQK